MTREQAEEFTRKFQKTLLTADLHCLAALLGGVEPSHMAEAFTRSLMVADLPADVRESLWRVVVKPRIDGLYAWPTGGLYRRYGLESVTWPEWDDYDPAIAEAAERLLAAEFGTKINN